MELQPSAHTHVERAEMVRTQSAMLLGELVDRLRGFTLEGFNDPGAIYDLSPMQPKSLAELASTYVRALKELGDLYQLSKPPVVEDDDDEDKVPMIEVAVMEQMIANAVEAAVAEAREDERALVLAEVSQRRQIEDKAAKAAVLAALRR